MLAPPPSGSVVDWAEENVYVATGPKQGRFSIREIPYAREPIDRFGDKNCRNLVLCFGSQSAKTTILICGALYRICRDPRDALWVMANADLAKNFSKERWIPWVKKCDPAFAMTPKSVRGGLDKGFSFCNQQFANMNLNFVGSNSPANLSSRPCGILIQDETDKYAEESRYEAGALELAEERTKAYNFAFIAKASTPTVAGRMITPEFNKTDQRYYYVPCPRCSEYIRLLFNIETEEHGDCGVRWWREDPSEAKTDGIWDMAKVIENAHYKCQLCGGEVNDYERHGMIENGVWRPSNPQAPAGSHGYQLSSLYSVISEATSLPSIAVKWLQSSKAMGGRQNFINAWLAETWDLSRSVDEKKVVRESYTIVGDYDNSTICMGIDCQVDHFWAAVRRFAPPSPGKPFGESWLLAADRYETIEEIKELQKRFKIQGQNVVLDMRFRPNDSARLIIDNDFRGMLAVDTPKKFAHKVPQGIVERIYSEVCFRDPFMGTSFQDRQFERARYVKFNRGEALDILAALRYSNPTIFHISLDSHTDYQRHLNSVIKRPRVNPRTGNTEWYWQQLSDKDHLLDCELFCVMRALQSGLIATPGEIEVEAA